LSLGPVTVGGYTFSLYWMLLGMTLSILGLQSFYLGCLSQLFHDYTGRARQRWLWVFSYSRSLAASAGLAALGLGCLLPLLMEYFSYGFTLSGMPARPEHLAIFGLLCSIAAFANFVFTLVIHAAVLSIKPLKVRLKR
jgi:hypothetical protein